MVEHPQDDAGDMNIENQAREQTGQRRVRVRVDERQIDAAYANAFRANGTAEEVMLDFGLNVTQPTGRQEDPVEIVFRVDKRIVVNYYSAKRLAMTLGQMVRRYEQQFGEIELDVAKRRKDQM